MKQLTISYINLIVEDADIAMMASILAKATDEKGEAVNFSISKAPDVGRNKLEASIREELKDTLVAESQRYSNYWLQERAESEKLRKRIKELEGTQNESL